MNRMLTLGALGIGLLLPGTVRSQVGPVRASRADTTTIQFRRPVSRAVMEAAWAVADTQRPATAIIRRPTWSSQSVLRQRMIRQRPDAPAARIMVAARRLPRPTGPRPTAAQDTTISRQRAADFRLRADAIARIAVIPPRELHPIVAANLINELDSVGSARVSAPPIDSADPPEEQEQYPEYRISLAGAVLRVARGMSSDKKQSSVRSLVFGGLPVSREIQRFVADQGKAGLGALDTAFAASDATAPAVVSTWGYALAAEPSQLAFEDSVHVYARILLSAQYYPVAFTFSARHAKLFELMPELDSIAAQSVAEGRPALAGAARSASRKLAPARDSAKAVDWLARLRLRTGVVCMDESRLGVDTCQALVGATTSASGSLGNLDQLRQALAQYRGLLDQEVSAGRLSPEARGSLDLLVNGLLRAAGDRSGIRGRVMRPLARPPR